MSETTARLWTLRPLALDSSHLGQFVRDLNSRRADEQRRASEFEQLLDAGGWVLALCHHHLAEIYTHADAAVRRERLAYIRSLPIVGYVRASGGLEAGPGSILDVLATEVAAALAIGATNTAAIADAARPDVFAYASGRDVLRAADAVEPELIAHALRQQEQARRVVAISQADVERAPNLTLGQILRTPVRTPEAQEAFLRRYGAKLVSEVIERGDRDIADPADVAARFNASVAEAIRQVRESGVHPVAYLLEGLGLRPEELVEDATIEDLQRIAFHHHRASIAVAGSGLDPAVVRARVRAERLPSAIIGDALARFGQQSWRRKGSVMNDVHLACLSPYARLTSVDKGTLANVERAKAACPMFKSVIGAVARGRTYVDLMPRLGTDPGRAEDAAPSWE